MRNVLSAICTLCALLAVAPALADQPCARASHAMAPLSDDSVLLFGGLDDAGNTLGDTWVFSPDKGGAWIELTFADGPEDRCGHHMVPLPDGTVMMFGGEDVQANLMNDLHHFTYSMWESETPTGPLPPARRDHAMWAHDSVIYVFGGRGEAGDLNDLWAYDPAADIWEQKASAANPATGAAVGIAATLVYVLGYSESTPMYAYETNQWYEMPFGHDDLILRTMAANAGNDYHAWFFGGASILKNGAVLGDSWLFNFETAEFTQLADLPYPVTGAVASLVGDGASEKVFLFGGELAGGALSDILFSYDTTENTWDESEVSDDDEDDDDEDDDASDDDASDDDDSANDDEVDDDGSLSGADDDDDDGGCGC